MKDQKKVAEGKRTRAAGQRFELKVREEFEKDGWFVDKWSNSVEFHNDEDVHELPFTVGKLVKVKNKFLGPGRPMMLGAGFPDFIAFRLVMLEDTGISGYEIIGIESKMTGVLDKKEKEMCQWLLDNKVFSKILIAKKGEKRGKILCKDFRDF